MIIKIKDQAILAGGRYDDLMEQLKGPKTPAIGFAIGVDRIADILKDMPLNKKIAVINIDCAEYCFKVLNKLRDYNFSCTPYWGYELSKALKLIAKEYEYAIIVGSKEEENQTFIIKDLKKSKQFEQSIMDINVKLLEDL